MVKFIICFILSFVFFPDGILFSQKYFATKENNSCIERSNVDFTNYARSNNDSIKFNLLNKNNNLNPYAALGIALFGGSVLHGLGHWYAGHKNIFWILLSTEIVPPIIILITAFTSPSDNSIIYNTFNNIYPTLFVGTWAYDIIGAPIMCIRDNKRKNKNMIMVQPYIQNDLFANKIFIRFSYSF